MTMMARQLVPGPAASLRAVAVTALFLGTTMIAVSDAAAEEAEPMTPAQAVEAAHRTASSPATLYECNRAEAVESHVEASGPELIETAFARLHGTTSMSLPEATPCAMIQAGWWTYELCWGRYLRQFHVENQRITAEYFLGLGPRAAARVDPIMSRVSLYADGQRSVHHQLLADRDTAAWREMKRSQPPAVIKALATPGTGEIRCSRWLDARDRQLRFQAEAMAHQQMQQQPEAQQGNVAATGLSSRVVESIAGESPAVGVLMPAGTVCDKTGLPRRALIALSCEHERAHYIAFNVTEDADCSYVTYVTGAAICAVLRGEELPFPSAVGKGPPQKRSKGTEAKAAAPKSRSPTAQAIQNLKKSQAAASRAASEAQREQTARQESAADSQGAASASAEATPSSGLKPTHYTVGQGRPEKVPHDPNAADHGSENNDVEPSDANAVDDTDTLEDDEAPLYEGSMIFGLMG